MTTNAIPLTLFNQNNDATDDDIILLITILIQYQ